MLRPSDDYGFTRHHVTPDQRKRSQNTNGLVLAHFGRLPQVLKIEAPSSSVVTATLPYLRAFVFPFLKPHTSRRHCRKSFQYFVYPNPSRSWCGNFIIRVGIQLPRKFLIDLSQKSRRLCQFLGCPAHGIHVHLDIVLISDHVSKIQTGRLTI